MFTEFKHVGFKYTITFNDANLQVVFMSSLKNTYTYKDRRGFDKAILEFIKSPKWDYDRDYNHE